MRVSDVLRQRAGVNGRALSPIRVPMSRRELPILARDCGFTKGAEIGVWKGAYAATFCEANPLMHMLCVDPWQSYPAWLDTKNDMPLPQAQALIDEAHRLATIRLLPLNCSIIRKFSVEAAKDVRDRSLDLVYIDGNHVYDAVLADLTAWMPKVKPGGFIAGHDFRAFTNKPTIHVIEAVEAFTLARRIDPWFVLAADKTPSFLWEVH